MPFLARIFVFRNAEVAEGVAGDEGQSIVDSQRFALMPQTWGGIMSPALVNGARFYPI